MNKEKKILNMDDPVKIETGSLEIVLPRRTKEEELKEKKLKAVINIAYCVIIAFIVMSIIWMLLSYIILLKEGTSVDNMLKIWTTIIPFWSTMIGSVLGYLFGKKENV